MSSAMAHCNANRKQRQIDLVCSDTQLKRYCFSCHQQQFIHTQPTPFDRPHTQGLSSRLTHEASNVAYPDLHVGGGLDIATAPATSSSDDDDDEQAHTTDRLREPVDGAAAVQNSRALRCGAARTAHHKVTAAHALGHGVFAKLGFDVRRQLRHTAQTQRIPIVYNPHRFNTHTL